MDVSIIPDPKNKSDGNRRFFLKFTVVLDLTDARYTAKRAKMIPNIFWVPVLSLYMIIPKPIGMTTLIFEATEATDRPFFCAVIAMMLKIEMNKNPRAIAP